jgi:hypothetical protein
MKNPLNGTKNGESGKKNNIMMLFIGAGMRCIRDIDQSGPAVEYPTISSKNAPRNMGKRFLPANGRIEKMKGAARK